MRTIFRIAIIAIGLLFCFTNYVRGRYVPIIKENDKLFGTGIYTFDTHTGKYWSQSASAGNKPFLPHLPGN